MLRTTTIALALVIGLPSAASAASVCIAKDDTPFAPATVVGEAVSSVGFLAAGNCYGVLERLDSRTRIFVKAPTFEGEAEVRDSDLLQVLAEDIPLTMGPGEEPWGLALAGTAVAVEGAGADGGNLVRTVDGRVQVRFWVEEGAMLPAEIWPELEPDEVDPGGDWPEGAFALPPASTVLTGSTGTRASVGVPLFSAADVAKDSALGALRYSIVEETEFDVTAQIIAPTWWVQGSTTDLDWRRQSIAATEDEDGKPLKDDAPRTDKLDWDGWDDRKGYQITPPSAPRVREVGNKEAPIALEAKGDRFATIMSFARVDVLDTDGSWHKVTHSWDGGVITGWLDKRRLTKEGKEQAPPPVVVPPGAVVTVNAPEIAWIEKGPESEVDDEGNPKLDDEGQPVIDPNVTHTEDPEVTAPWLRRAVRERIARLRFLYGRAVAKNPKANGDITVRIVVAEDGTAEEIELVDATYGDEEVQDLIRAIVEAIELPERTIKKSRRDKKDYRVEVKMKISFTPYAA